MNLVRNGREILTDPAPSTAPPLHSFAGPLETPAQGTVPPEAPLQPQIRCRTLNPALTPASQALLLTGVLKLLWEGRANGGCG